MKNRFGPKAPTVSASAELKNVVGAAVTAAGGLPLSELYKCKLVLSLVTKKNFESIPPISPSFALAALMSPTIDTLPGVPSVIQGSSPWVTSSAEKIASPLNAEMRKSGGCSGFCGNGPTSTGGAARPLG